jgi:CHAD domain-containing protein
MRSAAPLAAVTASPPSISGLVFARTRGLTLSAIARLSTRRLTYGLRDASDTVLAELSDDHVRAEVFVSDGHELDLSAWREPEVELVAGRPRVLKQIGDQLLHSGATRSPRPSELVGVLGELPVGPDLPPPAVHLHPHIHAGVVVQTYLSEQAEQLVSADLRVRLHEPESIHDMRVASRRIRSTLGTFRRLFDAERARDLEDRLRDLGAQLGKARDSEVLLERLLAALEEVPQTFVLGPVRRRLQEELRGEYLRSRAAALEFMGSAAYATLLDDLMAFVRNGFIGGGRTDMSARDVLPKLVRRRQRKLVRRVDTADHSETGDERDQALHQARKAAKQARYAAEVATPPLGRAMARSAKRAKRIQEILGEHHDSVVAADALRRLGIAANAHSDESGFTFGVLAGLEMARAADARLRFEKAWN